MQNNYPPTQTCRQYNNTFRELSRFFLLAILIFSSLITKAQTCNTSVDFSSAITIGATQAPNTWYTDRYAPADFVAQINFDGGDRLKHSISTAGGAINRPNGQQSAFYNTQGRKLDLPTGTKQLEIKLYIDDDWATTNKRMAGFWGTVPNTNTPTPSYPIVEFTSDGNTPRFRSWESGTDSWVDMGLPYGFTYNQWVTLKIQQLPSNEFLYSVLTAEGNLYYTTTTHASGGPTYITHAILQGHNYDPNATIDESNPGVTYDIYWDDFMGKVGDGSVTNTTTNETFCSIQAAIDDADTQNGHTLTVAAGKYIEDIVINKQLTITGAGATSTTIVGPIGGNVASVRISANNVTISGFTITREGNNLSDWNNSQLNSAGVAIQGTSITEATIHDNIITGNRTAIDINNSNEHTIRNNQITDNHTGLIFRNQTDNITFTENVVTNNRTVGILFLDQSGGSNSPVQTALNSNFTNNNISGNWYGQVVDRQADGSLPTPGTTNLKNFSNNWYGSTSPVVTTSNSAEPSYDSLIPVAYGGTATAPGGQPDIAGPGSANIDFSPFLNDGTDTNVETTSGQGTNGFQGDFNTLWVTATGAQTSSTTRIQEGVDAVQSAGTLNVKDGTYDENVTINKSLTITGASAAGTIIKSPYLGSSANTVLIAAQNVTLKKLTVTRNYGATITDWNNSTVNQGININANGNGAILDELIVQDNRNGIYINNAQNVTIQNSIVKDNRTGVHFANNISGADVKNNFIYNNFTHGLLFNYDTPPGIVATNAKVNNNSIINNWYAQVNFQHNNISIPSTNDHSGLSFSCNWYGTTSIGVVAASANEPGYTSQNPSQFGGTDPGLNRQLYGTAIAQCPYAPYLNNGSDNETDTPGFQPVPNSCTYLVKNIDTNKEFGTIQAAINDATTANGHTIQIEAGSFNETINVTKNLTFVGANKDICGTASRSTETILVAPATETGVITLSGSVTATFNGFLLDGLGIAYLTQPNQGIVFKNSVFELDFLPGKNNFYAASSSVSLDCNYFKAIGGTNDGSSSHIFIGGSTSFLATGNTFTSETAISSLTGTTTSLPVWLNLTDNNNFQTKNNLFTKVDIGILLASTASGTVESNEFIETKRAAYTGGASYGAGIAIFENYAPSSPSVITKNKFYNSETGIRTSSGGAGPYTLPAPNQLTISYNSFETISVAAVRLADSYASSSNKLNVLCNWYGDRTGPIISTNEGASGVSSLIVDSGNKASYKNWLVYGDTDGALGFQLPTSFNVASTTGSSVADNNYRLLSNAVGCVLEGQTINLSGTFDYNNPTTLEEWAKGNDGDLATDSDNYNILAPRNLNNVTLVGPATIQGPGDLATANLEGFLLFDNGYNRNWDISGLTIKDFDLSIGFLSISNYPTNNSGLKIHDNTFYIPKDLNATDAPTDVNQNIGIHLSNGANQEINNNTVYIDGSGVSAGTSALSNSNFLQSHTTGGNGYDGLKITNNKIHVTGVPQAEPNQAVVRGIWENSHSISSDIEISGNTFENDDPANTADLNRQFAFWVTSRSGTGKPVVYKNNEVKGFSEGISWLGGPFTAYNPPPYEASALPVELLNNKFDAVKNGVVVRKLASSPNTGSPAVIHNNSFTNSVAGGFDIVNEGTGTTDATCNWYDGNPLVSNTGGGSITYHPKLASGTDDSPGTNGFQTSAACALPVHNVTKDTYFATIQAAIDDTGTTPGDVIEASDGTYNERVTVSKSLTITGTSKANTIIDGTGLLGVGSGITLDNNITGVTIQNFTIQNFTGSSGNTQAGIYAKAGNNNLTITDVAVKNNANASGIYANGPIENVLIDKVDALNNGPSGRGIVIWNGLKKNITVTNSNVQSNTCCGIELQDGSATGVLIKGNTILGDDSGLSLIGLTSGAGTAKASIIESNTLTVNGRFGIEIKNPNGTGNDNDTEDGAIIIRNNIVTFGSTTNQKDLAGIAVIRRGVIVANGNVDVPTGVVVKNNTVSGFTQSSSSEGFGIVIEGTNHTVTGNTLSGNDVGIQLQAGHTPYPGDGNDADLADTYFGRGNSPLTCSNAVNSNMFSSNGTDTRNVGASTGGLVTNLTTGKIFCSIQAAIDDPTTVNSHTISIGNGTYDENVSVTKTLILQGASINGTIIQGSSGIGLNIQAADVVLKTFTAKNFNYGIVINASGTAHKLIDLKITNNSIAGIAVPYSASAVNISNLEITNVTSTSNAEGLEVFATATGSKVFDNVKITNSNFSENTDKGIYIERANNLTIDQVTIDHSGFNTSNNSNNNGLDINLKFASYTGIIIKNSSVTNSGYQGTGGAAVDGPSAIAVKARNDGDTYSANPATLANILIQNNVVSGPENGIRIGEYGKINTGPSSVTVINNDLSASFANKQFINRTNNDATLICNYHGSTDYDDIVSKLQAAGTGKNLLNSVATDNTYSSCLSPTGITLTATSSTVCVGSTVNVIGHGLLPSTSTKVTYKINDGPIQTFTGMTNTSGELAVNVPAAAGPFTLTISSIESNTVVATVNPPVSVTAMVLSNAVAGTVSGASPLVVGATTTYSNSGGTAGGIWSSSNTLVATVDNNGVVTGVTSGTANIIYTVTGCSGTVSSQASVTIVNIDLVVRMYTTPTVVYSPNNQFTTTIELINISSVATSSTITVLVSKDEAFSLMLDNTLPSNNSWTLEEVDGNYKLTSTAVIEAGASLSIGLKGTVTPNNTAGTIPITAAITGGDTKINNNSGVSSIDYFP